MNLSWRQIKRWDGMPRDGISELANRLVCIYYETEHKVCKILH